MATRRPRHRYPIWMAWPFEIVALLIVVPTTWYYLRINLQIAFQQWPQALAALDLVPQVKAVALAISGTIPPGPIPWEQLYPTLLHLNEQMFALYFLACLIRNFMPQLRLAEEGLEVRRGLGWATIPWERITMVQSMNLPGDQLVLLVQGNRWRLGPWFRFYSLLWPSGLRKGIVISWHISDFETLAATLVNRLQEVYGPEGIRTVIDDMAYSTIYALIFQPQATWKSLFTTRQALRDAYSHPKWLPALMRLMTGLLLLASIWRYLGVWWRFLAGRFDNLRSALEWPLLGALLRSFDPIPSLSPQDPAQMRQVVQGLLLAQLNMILILIAANFILNLFPNWLLSAEGVSVQFRKRWIAIPWQAIRSIRETLFQSGGGAILIQTDRSTLSPWHSLYSLFYGAGLRRGVLFSSLLPGFENLRQRIHLGIVRTYEQEEQSPSQPILQEGGEAEFLRMLREPTAKLEELAHPEGKGQQDQPAGLLRSSLRYTPESGGDLPWTHDMFSDEEGQEQEKKESRRSLGRALRAALSLASWVLVLVLLEELLFPPLSRSLALVHFPLNSPALGGGAWLLASLVMALLVVLEWPLAAGLLSLVAEMFNRPGEFKRALSLYPRLQSPRSLVCLPLLILAATGLFQPLILSWWILAGIWGGILLWLSSRELYQARGVANILLIVGYTVYQALVLMVYFAFR
ncbi:MAG: hypothetical protein JXA37_07490 [Chloroflexia bacterium]|nr:hypothetical protein [Chloroflexia bacterium]